jgi:hypothetical protein
MATTLSQCCKNDAKVVYLVGATVVQLSASQTAKTIVAQVSLHLPAYASHTLLKAYCRTGGAWKASGLHILIPYEQDPSILNMLIRMMRGAAAPTQLNSAKALCNLACDPECARVMIRNKSMEGECLVTFCQASESPCDGKLYGALV